jgi:membrane protease subunit HflC
MQKSLGIIVAIGGFLLFLVLNAYFVVNQTQVALVTEFGRPVKVVQESGLKFKIPFIQSVEYFDRRILEYRMSQLREINSLDQKRVVISAFVKWRVVDPLKFAQTTRTGGVGTDREAIMNNRLETNLESSLRQVLGSYPLSDLLSPKRAQIMREIRDLVNIQVASQKVRDEQAQADTDQAVKDGKVATAMASTATKSDDTQGFGIEIVDVKILRADLPAENSNAIFKRMQTEREREAKDFRAKGEEEAQRIKSKADKDRTILLAEAQKKAETLRGEGDAIASKTYASAFSKDPQFYDFYRSMQAYTKSLNKDDTTVIMSPDSKFLRQMDGQ